MAANRKIPGPQRLADAPLEANTSFITSYHNCHRRVLYFLASYDQKSKPTIRQNVRFAGFAVVFGMVFRIWLFNSLWLPGSDILNT